MLVAKGWSQEESVEGIVEYIVIDEVAFSCVESEGFRRMMCKVQPKHACSILEKYCEEFIHYV